MRRIILTHPKVVLLDAIVDGFGNIYQKECFDNIYLKTIECVIKGEYELEFEDELFKIDEKDVLKNIEKLKENPLYRDKIEIKKITPKDILEYTNQKEAPINLDKICNFFNIDVNKKEDIPFDGFSKYEDEKYFIYYKSGITSSFRERFTIAHELGHIFLHFSENKKFFKDETLNKKLKQNNIKIAARGLNNHKYYDFNLEREANNFAANLLMPSNLLLKEITYYEFINETAIKELSETFKVSREAIKNRLKNLGIIPNY
jgi:Zn-dependent peptidase ImmA (M78 family)